MKKNYLLFIALLVTSISMAQSPWINEIHYDNAGGDVDEGVEIDIYSVAAHALQLLYADDGEA